MPSIWILIFVRIELISIYSRIRYGAAFLTERLPQAAHILQNAVIQAGCHSYEKLLPTIWESHGESAFQLIR